MNDQNPERSIADASSGSHPTKTPWHLWVVGLVSLLWNAMGVMDYLMTMTKNEDYMSAFTEEQLEYFYNFPGWVVIFWTIAVWGSLLGSILLLFRSKFAVPTLAASLASMVITAFYNFVLTNGLEIMGTGGAIFTVVIFVIALLLVVYARAMSRRDVLK